MADWCTPELDDVQRWLPPEILADVGITDAPPSGYAAVRRRLAVVEDIAVHLAGLLSRTGMGNPPPPPPPPEGAASYHCHPPQVCGFDGGVLVANGGLGRSAVAPPFFPAPAVRWQVGEGFGSGGALHPAAAMPWPALAPAGPCGGGAAAAAGTGVFLPRIGLYPTRPAKTPVNGVKPPKGWHQKQKRQGGEVAAMRKQKQKLHATMAAEKQQQQDSAASAALHALPQEWTY